MSLWKAEDAHGDGAILQRAAATSEWKDVVAFLAAAEQGVYLTRGDVAKLRDACDQLLAGGAPGGDRP